MASNGLTTTAQFPTLTWLDSIKNLLLMQAHVPDGNVLTISFVAISISPLLESILLIKYDT